MEESQEIEIENIPKSESQILRRSEFDQFPWDVLSVMMEYLDEIENRTLSSVFNIPLVIWKALCVIKDPDREETLIRRMPFPKSPSETITSFPECKCNLEERTKIQVSFFHFSECKKLPLLAVIPAVISLSQIAQRFEEHGFCY